MSTRAVRKGDIPHVEFVDIGDNGVAVEVIVIKRDPYSGDLYFIPTEHLDNIDRKRMYHILTKRDAEKYDLWDLMSQTTLGNGENALEYFHQLVRVLTESGEMLTPSTGRSGIALKREESEQPQKKRGPGRPPKS